MRVPRRTLLSTAAGVLAGQQLLGRSRMVRAAEKVDVVIIGAGFAGLKAAIELAEQGAKVCLL